MQNQCKQWDMRNIFNIMFTCVILHNIFFEDEQDKNLKHCLNPIVAHRISREVYPSKHTCNTPKKLEFQICIIIVEGIFD
jgi:hypothetical protein